MLSFAKEDVMKEKKAVFAGGCFWCVESTLEKVPGVIKVISGYTGGQKLNPTYEQVSRGDTGHVEAIEITYDPDQVTYDRLLEAFWQEIDPTDSGGQFADRGSQYKTAIFYMDEQQKDLAEKSRDRLGKSGRYDKPIVTPILPAVTFYPAEDYHQNYAKKNPAHYGMYRFGSGREPYLKKIWGADKPQK
ncbi:MAG: peptide-methionine (S)-S-oxide reductase MsrA [Candidatus Omnitrophica bacterium]|nr:peptide-methionine (S)-S-oxide reductase MsrA [Candidatus Omnitrophota bacterium]